MTLKHEFFNQAMRAQEYRRTAWVVSAFSRIYEGPDDWKQDPYPYRIVQTPTATYYVNPENTTQLIQIDDAPVGEAPFQFEEKVYIKAGEIPNLHEDITTTYGNLLYNWLCIVYAFGSKIDYIRGRVTPGQIEKMVLERYEDYPPEGVSKNPTAIYTDEWLRCANAHFHLENFSQLAVPAGSEKSMVTHPDMAKVRRQLYEENKDRLHDPAVIASIIAKLKALDKEWLKDDKDAMGFLIKNKSFETVRRKLYYTIGAEQGLEDGVAVKAIERPLVEGWDVSAFPELLNTARAGSFNRGAQTQLGGVEVKTLLRASSNIRVAGTDCGSRLGVEARLTNENSRYYVGHTVILEDGTEKLTKENIGSYLGKTVRVRSAMYCQFPKTGYCEVCIGDKLSLNPTGLFTAISQIGSTMLGIFMSAAHAKPLVVEHMDYMTSIR